MMRSLSDEQALRCSLFGAVHRFVADMNLI